MMEELLRSRPPKAPSGRMPLAQLSGLQVMLSVRMQPSRADGSIRGGEEVGSISISSTMTPETVSMEGWYV